MQYYALKMGTEGMFCSTKLQLTSEIICHDDMRHHSCVARKDSSVIWSAIIVEQVMNYTLSSLHFEILLNTISFHINLLPYYASHRLEQDRCLALEDIIFCLTIVACDVSVIFLNAGYISFGPVFFCTY